ncbi:MAG: hypothetical protein PHN44_10220 [Candidatus Marinimicrobia bacterium]|nr:hypothetical protein [Candidatus Neomarinimicrobiota bacterium]
MNDLIQLIIAVLGIPAIVLVGKGEDRLRKWGYLVGLAGQPLWIWGTWLTRQWGILILAMIYIFVWGQGVWHYWVAPKLGKGKVKILSDQAGAVVLGAMVVTGLFVLAGWIVRWSAVDCKQQQECQELRQQVEQQQVIDPNCEEIAGVKN